MLFFNVIPSKARNLTPLIGATPVTQRFPGQGEVQSCWRSFRLATTLERRRRRCGAEVSAMPYRHILYEKDDRIARVILNRPRQRNAQSRILLEELDQAFAEAIADDEVRVVILSGAGDHFSSGHDLGTAEELEDEAKRPYGRGIRDQHRRSWDLYLDNTLRWRDLPKPTIAQ